MEKTKAKAMKRPTKYRAWNPRAKRMETEFDISSDGQIFKINMFETVEPKPEWILLQYIGLKDKNRKEIYDADIVKDHWGRVMKVGVWNYRLCWIALNETNFHHADFYEWVSTFMQNPDDVADVLIIGNIYENPELLKKQKPGKNG